MQAQGWWICIVGRPTEEAPVQAAARQSDVFISRVIPAVP